MIFYHGTSTEHLESILAKGILPRKETGRPSNYEGKVESTCDFVYLSKANPMYYASNAAEPPNDPLVLKVDISEEFLFPDEDYIAYWLRKGGESDVCESQIDPTEFKEVTQSCIRNFGNVAVPYVSISNIVEHRVVPLGRGIYQLGIDLLPTPDAYMNRGGVYESCLEALFQFDSIDNNELLETLYRIHDADFGFTPDDEVSLLYKHRNPDKAPKSFVEHHEQMQNWFQREIANGRFVPVENDDESEAK